MLVRERALSPACPERSRRVQERSSASVALAAAVAFAPYQGSGFSPAAINRNYEHAPHGRHHR